MIKNILIPLDGSEHSNAALDYAIWMTEQFDGMLLGQHIIDSVALEGSFFHDVSGSLGFEPYLDFSTKMREILEERGKGILSEFTQRCQSKGIKHQTFLDMGIIANEICERAKVADLVVIGHRGVNEEFTTGLLGTTTESITRKCPRPIFVSTKQFKTIQKPLLAYDGSQRASSAMESAAEFCTVLKLPLTVLSIAKEDESRRSDRAAGQILSEFLFRPGKIRNRPRLPRAENHRIPCGIRLRPFVHRRPWPPPDHQHGSGQHDRVCFTQ